MLEDSIKMSNIFDVPAFMSVVFGKIVVILVALVVVVNDEIVIPSSSIHPLRKLPILVNVSVLREISLSVALSCNDPTYLVLLGNSH